MVHDLIVAFPKDAQGGKAGDVVLPAQIHLLCAVDLHHIIPRDHILQATCSSACITRAIQLGFALLANLPTYVAQILLRVTQNEAGSCHLDSVHSVLKGSLSLVKMALSSFAAGVQHTALGLKWHDPASLLEQSH